MPGPVVVLNVVGLTPRLLAHTPRLRRLAGEGFQATIRPAVPAVTCTAQATMLTGVSPAEHGIVGNGWYFRELGEVLLWRQHNRLVQAEPVWETARRIQPDFTVANLCWWYAMGASTDITVTPRPIYHADGRKSPDCYTDPPGLHDRLTTELGQFPLFSYWGPGAGIASSEWIARAARSVIDRDAPDLTLVYLPHLDYDLQRFGPDSRRAVAAAHAIDAVAGGLADHAMDRGATVVVLSEYGVTAVSRQVHINRALRSAGLLRVYRQDGMEYLDPWTSRAFAVADHQFAHLYVRDPADVPAVGDIVTALPGVETVLGDEGKRAAGLAHDRSGELVAVAEPDAWFTYYYWLEDRHAPDFARTVDIHRKPGYDPAELFLDPGDPLVKLRAAMALARKRAGLRYTLNVVPLSGRWVRGSHGRRTGLADGPVLICSDPAERRDAMDAHEVRDLLLALGPGLTPIRAGSASRRTRS